MNYSTPGLPVHHQLPESPKPMSIVSVMPSNHLILCRPLLLLPFPSIRVFSNESILHIRWPKYWSFSFSISPSNEYSGLISFSINWLGPLAVHRTLKSLLQYHSSKASIFQHSFLHSPTLTSVHDYWKNHSFTRQTFVGKVMPLLFRSMNQGKLEVVKQEMQRANINILGISELK